MNDEQKKLYQLIWRRAVASQMKDAQTLRTKISTEVVGGNIPDFSITGSQITFDGWLKGDPASRSDDVELPKVTTGEAVDLTKVSTEEKHTEPPSRYSEAGLIKELEKRGIGRPSTYASILRTIEDRGYVEKVNKALFPTDTGDVVSSFLENNFAHYISDGFTAEMEDKLDLIAEGKEDYVHMLTDFYKPFQKEIKIKDKLDKATNMGEADPKFKCPICEGPMIIKLSRGGKFLSCAQYPDCNGALTMEGQEIKKDEPIGTDPKTGLQIFVQTGRFGPYVQLGVMPPRTSKLKVQKIIDPATGKPVKKPRRKQGDPKPEPVPKPVKPRMASIPKGKDPSAVTIEDALLYLSLPKVLGMHPQTGLPITANIGRFGPYVVHEKDFRSLKEDDVYSIELPRALEILAQEKKKRGFVKKTIK